MPSDDPIPLPNHCFVEPSAEQAEGTAPHEPTDRSSARAHARFELLAPYAYEIDDANALHTRTSVIGGNFLWWARPRNDN